MKPLDERELMREALAPSSDCPAVDVLGGWLDGTLAAAVADALRPHLSTCPRCAAELAALGEFSGATERSGEAADVDWIVRRLEKRAPKAAPARRELWASFFRFPTLAVVTASLVILVSGGLYIESLREPAVAPGSGREANVMRSTKIRAIAPAGDLRQVPRTFNWEPMAGAVRYEVSVAEVDRNQVWSADAGGPGTDIPPIVSRLIVPRKTLAWQVAAFDGRGARLGESDWISFRLVP